MKKAFKVKQKAFFIIFKGLSVGKNSVRHESLSLIFMLAKFEVLSEHVVLKVPNNRPNLSAQIYSTQNFNP